jgi:hypothetical protein
LGPKLLILHDISGADRGFFGPNSGVLLLFSSEAGEFRAPSAGHQHRDLCLDDDMAGAAAEIWRMRLLGSAWEPFAGQTSIVPFAAIATGKTDLSS